MPERLLWFAIGAITSSVVWAFIISFGGWQLLEALILPS